MAGMQSTFSAIKTKCIVSAAFSIQQTHFASIIFIFLFSSLLQEDRGYIGPNYAIWSQSYPIQGQQLSSWKTLSSHFRIFFFILTPLHYEKAAWGMRTCCWGHPFVMLSMYNIENPPECLTKETVWWNPIIDGGLPVCYNDALLRTHRDPGRRSWLNIDSQFPLCFVLSDQ